MIFLAKWEAGPSSVPCRIDRKGARMVTYEFVTQVDDDGVVKIPPAYRRKLRTGEPVRVILQVVEPAAPVAADQPQPDKQAADEALAALEETVARIQRLGPNPNNITPASGRLAEHLAELESEIDPDFDSEAWLREWGVLEAQMEAEQLAHEAEEWSKFMP
jgi:hypothetical protein